MTTTDILKSVIYDMRILANSLSGSLEMLRDTSLDQNQLGLVDQAGEASESLMGLVNLALDYEDLQNGQFKLNNVEFDLATVVEESAESMSVLARANKASLMTFISPDMPLRLRGDEARLRQVLNFLFAKAINHSPSSELILRVTPDRASPSESTGRSIIRFALEQNADTEIPRQSSSKRDHDLSEFVLNAIVQHMGGQLSADVDPSGSQMMWFNAKFEPAASATAEKEMGASREGADDSFLLNARVMVVDDSKANRDVLYYYMRSWGLGIAQSDCFSRASDALEALQQAQSNGRPYDVVILDLAMPEMDGLQLARLIRKDPALDGVSLVLLTAFDYEVHRDEANEIGFSAYLTKPVRQSQLLDAIASAAYEQSLPAENMQIPADILVPPKHTPETVHCILIAEDNVANQKLALAQLERLGYAASAVNSGAKAIEEFSKNSHLYSLILMDCQMPDVDGFTATRAIRKEEAARGGHIPIIAMTATVTRGAREACLAAGMDDYLSKPVSRDALHTMLIRWIDV